MVGFNDPLHRALVLEKERLEGPWDRLHLEGASEDADKTVAFKIHRGNSSSRVEGLQRMPRSTGHTFPSPPSYPPTRRADAGALVRAKRAEPTRAAAAVVDAPVAPVLVLAVPVPASRIYYEAARVKV